MMRPCDCCGKPTSNPRFCCRSCSSKITNRETPKRTPKKRICTGCGSSFCRSKSHNSIHRCSECHVPAEQITEKTLKTTLGYLRNQLHLAGKHPSWVHSVVRQHARKVHKKLVPCPGCSYDKHVECCHIRDITDFPDSATLGEVNSKRNVVLLCRNCHWEFDNDILFLEVGPDDNFKFRYAE